MVSTMFCKAKSPKNYFFFAASLDHFQTKMFKSETIFSITFPKGIQISRNIGYPMSGRRGKKTFKQYLKSEHTDTQTDIALIESIGPEGRCFEITHLSQLCSGGVKKLKPFRKSIFYSILVFSVKTFNFF